MENIRIAVLSADNKVVGFLDNSAPGALHFYSDSIKKYLEGNAGTFSFTAPAMHPEATLLVAGNKLSFRKDNRDWYYTIVKSEPGERDVYITAYSTCLDLINETVGSYEASAAKTFVEYMDVFTDETYMVVNLNEVSDRKIKTKWDGSATLLSRLYSLANEFSAEIEFLPVLNTDYTLHHIEVNIYKQHSDTDQGIGQRRKDVTLRFGKNVKSVRKTVDITGLFTSIYATGKEGLTISSINRTVNDADGNVLYKTTSGSGVLYAPQARARYPSSVAADGGYIQYTAQTDYEDAEDLYGYMLGRLKELSEPAISYKVDGYEQLNVGDTVRIIDEGFNPPLYLEARVTQQNICLTDPTKNQTIFDNFTEMVSRVREIDTGLKKGEDAVLLRIDSSRGLLFKNNMVSTVLSVTIYSGPERITNSTDLRRVFGNTARLEWYWQRLDDDAFGIISAADSRLSDSGFHFTLTPEDVDTKVTFMCQLMLD